MDKLPGRCWPESMGKPLSSKQWRALQLWFEANREYFEGRSVVRILMEKRPKDFPRCPVKQLDANMILEGAKLANIDLELGEWKLCNRCNKSLSPSAKQCKVCGGLEFRYEGVSV